MKLQFKLIAFLIFGILTQNMYAKLGTALSYEYFGNNKYKVKLHYFRDCRGIGLNSTQTVNLEGISSCFTAIPITVSRDTIINRTLQCASGTGCNVQNGMGNAGIEEHIFSKIIDLDSPPFKTVITNSCCDLYFSFNKCCRPSSLTNGMSSGSHSNFAYLNRCFGKNNSSSTFQNKAPLSIYCNNTFEYNPFVRDIDGDSLVFSLDTAKGSSIFSNLTYNAPLSAQIPITPVCPSFGVTCTPALLSNIYVGFDFDSSTNNIRLTPKDCNEVTVFVNRVDEYKYDSATKTWNKVGVVRLDQMIFVSSFGGNNIMPEIDIKENHYLCYNDTFFLAINSSDKAPNGGLSDSTFLSWQTSNSAIDIKILNPSAKNQSALLKWKPDSADISLKPYLVNLKTRESNCVKPGQASKAIKLYVVDSLAANPTIIDRKNGTLYLKANITGGSTLLSNEITWLIDTTLRFSTSQIKSKEQDSIIRLEPGKYYVRLIVVNGSSCSIFITDSIVIAPYFRFDFEKAVFDVCKKNELSIKPIIKDAKRPITYQWYVVGNSTQISSDSILKRTVLTNETYFLNALDADNKNYNETVSVNALTLPDLSTVRNPAPKCFDNGAINPEAAFPEGNNFSWSEKANTEIWYRMKDKRRDTMISKGVTQPHTYFVNRFFDLSRNNNYIPNPTVDTLIMYARYLVTGCVDSSQFTIAVNQNPTIVLKSINHCQGSGSFPLASLVTSPADLSKGNYTWSIESAPSTLTGPELNQILRDENPSPQIQDYTFNPLLVGAPVNNPGNVKRLGNYTLRFCYTDTATNCQKCGNCVVTIDSTPLSLVKPFTNLCDNSPIINLNNYINLQQGRWELKTFNGANTGMAFDAAKNRLIDTTRLNPSTGNGTGGVYELYYKNNTLNCPVLDSATFTINERPTILISPQKDSLYLGERVDLEIIEGQSLDLSWENGSINLTRTIRESALAAGVYNFIATGLNNSTKCQNKDTAIISVFKTDRPVSVKNLLAQGLSLFPNPSYSQALLKSKTAFNTIDLYDVNGKLIKSISTENATEYLINTENLANGIYLITVSSESQKAYLKLKVNN